MPASLAVTYLRNANPAPYRTDLEDLEDLAKDIKVNGITTPLLVRPDFQLIDGYRRLEVAERLGHKQVPIQKIISWADLMQYYHPAAEDCLPMQWIDLRRFWGVVLKPLHQAHRIKIGLQARRGQRAPARRSDYSGFTLDLATLYECQPANIKIFRDYFKRLETHQQTFPTFVKGVYRSLPTGQDARNLAAARVIKAVFEQLFYNELSEEDALYLFRQRLAEVLANAEKPRVTRSRVVLNLNEPPAPTKTLRSFATVLGQLAGQAAGFRNFDCSADQAQELIDEITVSLAEVSSLRRRLRAVVRTAQEDAQAQETIA